MELPRLQLPPLRASRPAMEKFYTDGGVRRHWLGLLRSRNDAQAIIDRFYGPQGPPVAGQTPAAERDHVAVPTPQVQQPGRPVPGDD